MLVLTLMGMLFCGQRLPWKVRSIGPLLFRSKLLLKMVHEFTQISFDGTECFSIRIQLPLKMVLSELKRIRENNKIESVN